MWKEELRAFLRYMVKITVAMWIAAVFVFGPPLLLMWALGVFDSK